MNLNKLKSDIKRLGLIRSLYIRIMRRIGQHLGIHVNIVRSTAMGANAQFPEIPSNISLQLISADRLLKAIENPTLLLSRKFVQAAIDRGDLAFGAFDGPVLVSYIWRTFSHAPHTEKIWVRVPPPYCYAYNSFTLPKYRGLHISPAVHIFSDVEMYKRKFTHRAGFVAVTNSASLAMGKYMGTRRIGYAGYVKFRTGAVKQIGFEFFEGD